MQKLGDETRFSASDLVNFLDLGPERENAD